MVSLFTGRHVDGHQVYFGCGPDGVVTSSAGSFSDGWFTLAEALKEAGYTNYAFVTNPNVAPGLGMEQGFSLDNYVYEVNAPASRVTEAAIDRTASLAEPFFIYLHYMDPHVPYTPPAEHLKVFGKAPFLRDADRNALLPDIQLHYVIDSFRCSLDPARVPRFEPLRGNGRAALRMRYEGECRYADEQVAFLVTALQETFPNTLFIITSDHGEEFWEHGGLGHGAKLYEETLHVPLIMHGPGIAAALIDEPVSTLGLYKTLSVLLSLPLEHSVSGLNLLDPIPPGHTVFARTCGPEPGLPIDLLATRREAFKLITDKRNKTEALYCIGEDPGEHTNLKDTWNKALQELNALRQVYEQAMATLTTPDSKVPAKPFPPDIKEQLEALGYLGTSPSTPPE